MNIQVKRVTIIAFVIVLIIQTLIIPAYAAAPVIKSTSPEYPICSADNNIFPSYSDSNFWTFTNWTDTHTQYQVSLETGNAHSTSGYSLKYNNWSGHEAVAPAISIEKNTEYTFSVWLKRMSVQQGYNGLRVYIGNQNLEVLNGYTYYTTQTGEVWEQFAISFNSGDQNVFILKIHDYNTGSLGYLLLDDFYLFKTEHGEYPIVLDPIPALIDENPGIKDCQNSNNLIPDNSFESGQNSSFTLSSTYFGSNFDWGKITTDSAYTGNFGVELHGAKWDVWSGPNFNPSVTIEPYTKYTFSYRYKLTGAGLSSADQIIANHYSGDENDILLNSLIPEKDGQWHQVSFSFYSGSRTQFKLIFKIANSDITLYLDDFYFFETFDTVKNHPANVGRDYKFNGKISETVLGNYLSRAMTLSFLSSPSPVFADDERMILDTGVKYVARATIPWGQWDGDSGNIIAWGERINKMHKIDPDLIFETCIFEIIQPAVNNKKIPDDTYDAFGLPRDNRNFNYSQMYNAAGFNYWGAGSSLPDITKQETQMWFFTRAAEYIDAGFEAIHFGQVNLMASNNTSNYHHWGALFNKVRAYAKANSRRHMVLINAHTYSDKMKDMSNKLYFDFVSYPLRLKETNNLLVSGSTLTTHVPSLSNPQETNIHAGFSDSIYGKTPGGITPSGNSVSRLQYLVELDNYDNLGTLNRPGNSGSNWGAPWGYDEISWFANQTSDYRALWLDFMYKRVKIVDSFGHFSMPGSRPAYLWNGATAPKSWYYANDNSSNIAYKFKDEDIIKSLFIANNQ